MEEDAAGFEAGVTRHLDVADEPVAGEVDEVLELHRDPQTGVLQGHGGDQRVLRVSELPFPAGFLDPRELAVDEEARPAYVAHGLVGISNAREKQIAHRIVGVEAHEHIAISDNEASRHVLCAL